ncbi:hypothetical protein LOTGIDRAFT_134423, partial [Lottia gigantea]
NLTLNKKTPLSHYVTVRTNGIRRQIAGIIGIKLAGVVKLALIRQKNERLQILLKNNNRYV